MGPLLFDMKIFTMFGPSAGYEAGLAEFGIAEYETRYYAGLRGV
jgi:hypothetical protein